MQRSFLWIALIVSIVLVGCTSESDNDESNGAARIEVTYPESGAILDLGRARTLRWEWRDFSGPVRISLTDTPSGFEKLIAESASNIGTYPDFAPDSVCFGCRIRIESVEQPEVYDESGQFSVVYPWSVTYLQENALYGVDYVDDGGGTGGLFACGGDGTIVHWSEEYGSYTTVVIDSDIDLYAVDAVSETRAWVVGQGGAIYHAASNHYDWQPQNSGVTVPLRSVYFANDGLTGYVVGGVLGAGGVLLRTNDGGETWSGSILSLSAAALCVHGDSTVVWIGQEDGVIWKLQDGTATTDTTDLGAITDVAADWQPGFFGQLVAPAVYAISQSGAIQRYIDYSDGGVWEPLAEGTSESANWGKLFANEPFDYCWAAGPGSVLRTGGPYSSGWYTSIVDPEIGDAWVMDITGWRQYRDGNWYLWAVTEGGAILTAFNGALDY